jgi:hypothetical protein
VTVNECLPLAVRKGPYAAHHQPGPVQVESPKRHHAYNRHKAAKLMARNRPGPDSPEHETGLTAEQGSVRDGRLHVLGGERGGTIVVAEIPLHYSRQAAVAARQIEAVGWSFEGAAPAPPAGRPALWRAGQPPVRRGEQPKHWPPASATTRTVNPGRRIRDRPSL